MKIDIETVTITDEQAAKIQTWLEANSKVTGWLDGYALGSSYIDTRAKSGARADGRQAYVKLDHATAQAVPELRGNHARDIRDYMVERAQPAVEAPKL